MCGICGVVNGPGARMRVENSRIRQMCAVLGHRGPDDEGVWTDGVAGLGQRRLAIIDLSPAGHQPMCDETGRIWITFNGEVYNFPELRADLERRGHRFHSQTDTETVIHLYQDAGTETPAILTGMFAFALWDADRQRLLLARDRLGQKPLYYGIFGGALYFASEIKAILAVPDVPRQVNWLAIDHYLTYGYVPGSLTAFEGIHKLLPAHYLLWENGKVGTERYWNLAFSPKLALSRPEAEEQLLALLGEAVRMQLISDVPLGAFLSGGVDSSTIVALMSQFSSRVRTFSIGFREMGPTNTRMGPTNTRMGPTNTRMGMSELPYARQVASHFGTEHQEFIVEARSLEILPQLVWHYDEPFGDVSAIPTYYVSQMTRQAVTVALSGDGGDENFGGYERYQPQYQYSPLDWIPAPIRRYPLAWLAQRMPVHCDQRKLSWKVRQHLGAAGVPPAWYLRTIRVFTEDMKDMLYSQQMRERVGSADAEAWYRNIYLEGDALSRVERSLRADLLTYLPDAMLVKVDVASMAHSLEVRSPFLDHNVVEFAARLPTTFKVRGREGKYILKRALERVLPGEILYRRKRGFRVPLDRWLKGEMRDFVQDVLYAGDDLPYFDPAAVRQLISVYMEGRGHYAPHLWGMLNLYLWHRMFIERSISPPGIGQWLMK